MTEKIAKLKRDMKRLPELANFAENAKDAKSRILIKAKMLEELDALAKLTVHLYDDT